MPTGNPRIYRINGSAVKQKIIKGINNTIAPNARGAIAYKKAIIERTIPTVIIVFNLLFNTIK